eukprot:CAMPEP_0185731300 /NCGR_PEP_ID=MMETSP1171-20130828/12513_1 /TAXON_ID=374046 /ORGANISM="Helicotheca tamensis, Strain CCMP826" /LENGTH=125 /DNA_ID=CAMNT_0028400537 /DNA_START=120 /DNA_END=497 /DNA_ORIENTATION=+
MMINIVSIHATPQTTISTTAFVVPNNSKRSISTTAALQNHQYLLKKKHAVISTTTSSSNLFNSPNKEEEKDASYYQGFLNRDITEEPAERVSGDALLGPTLKLAGGTTVVMGVLILGFMASNGLL